MPKLKDENRKKYYSHTIEFATEEARDDFKNYVHGIKYSKGTPIYQTVSEMVELHKKANKR